jgi:hypothetical protein
VAACNAGTAYAKSVDGLGDATGTGDGDGKVTVAAPGAVNWNVLRADDVRTSEKFPSATPVAPSAGEIIVGGAGMISGQAT